MLKVSYPPFYFECWFHDNIVDENVSAIINNGIIALKFKKATEGMWPSLFHPDSGNLTSCYLIFPYLSNRENIQNTKKTKSF
jgi:hypothetical protein